MSVERLVGRIQEENARDQQMEVSGIVMNESFWNKLKERHEFSGNVQVMAVDASTTQYCFCGIPVEFDDKVDDFSLRTSPRPQ